MRFGENQRAINGSKSQTGRGYIPGAGANHRHGERIYREREPITDRERVYTGSWSQSQTGREDIPGAGANHRQGEGIYLRGGRLTGLAARAAAA
eukprot:5707803-Pyramimonas_sp.AAC.1